MAGKRRDDGRVCLCDRPDGTCAGLAVQRLSRDRVRDLAETVWGHLDASDPEALDADRAAYRTLYGDYSFWVRPLAMFTEHVERDGYAGPRFRRIA